MGNCFFDVEGKKETIWTIARLASTLLAEMPELGTLSRSEAGLSGLAPYNRETGVHSGRRTPTVAARKCAGCSRWRPSARPL